ncbi:hypothetical protein C6P40_002428 [Pichia californica]|uniref:Zn(2)-C6 fungal-type domain-containing protein n=1 Tax=Pichia californica TaxID=460514 RepID=A0A9P7BI90_9ASCO|nr:hypothetical protein C6P40_002428 [[Candida] californica]
MNHTVPILQPSILKSCSKCRSRRVKCDMSLPICDRCKSRGEICDICDMVFYDFSTVRNLQLMLSEFENKSKNNYTISLNNNEKRSNKKSHSTFNTSIEASLSEEVGSLSSTDKNYIGTASGAIFSKIFLKQLNIPNINGSFNGLDKLNSNLSNINVLNIPIVSLPSKDITKYLFEIYLEHIQIFYPILDINNTTSVIDNIYEGFSKISSSDKYILFMILSISSQFAINKPEYKKLNDLNSPLEYFSMAYNFLNDSISIIDLQSIKNILLLIIWCLGFKNQDENENLWILTRHVTSLCIQLGLHRNNPKWELDTKELEIRNRIWWTCYILERLVALQTGRTLSIRNYAIDAEMPKFNDEYDIIQTKFNLNCSAYENLCFQPMYLLAKIRTIGGDILESVYIARSKGKTLAVESVYKSAARLREELDLWLESIMDLYIGKNKWIYNNLKLNYNIYSLALSRPSPTYPKVLTSSSKVCLNDSKSFIDIVFDQVNDNCVMEFWFISANIITVGVTFLFSSWVLKTDIETTKGYIDKIIKIIDYLTADSNCDLSNVKLFSKVAQYTLEHLNMFDKDNTHNTSIKETVHIEDDEERKQFILNYLLNISEDGPFYLVQDND